MFSPALPTDRESFFWRNILLKLNFWAQDTPKRIFPLISQNRLFSLSLVYYSIIYKVCKIQYKYKVCKNRHFGSWDFSFAQSYSYTKFIILIFKYLNNQVLRELKRLVCALESKTRKRKKSAVCVYYKVRNNVIFAAVYLEGRILSHAYKTPTIYDLLWDRK